jgi:hypothetical protein
VVHVKDRDTEHGCSVELWCNRARSGRVRLDGHGRGRKETTNSDYKFGLLGFNGDQGFVTGFLNVIVKTMGAGLSDTRCPIIAVLNEMIVLIPNSLILVSRS